MVHAVQIQLENVTATDAGGHNCLQGLNAIFELGSYTQIAGPHGSLACTLLDLVHGRREPCEGRVHYSSWVASDEAPAHASSRGSSSLVDHMTVEQNLLLGPRTAWMSRKDGRVLVQEVLGDLELAVDLDTPCEALSPLERWGVALARAVLLPASSYFIVNERSACSNTVMKGLMKRALARIRERHEVTSPVLVANVGLSVLDIELATHLLCLRDGRQTYFGSLTPDMMADWPVFVGADGDAAMLGMRNALHRLALVSSDVRELFTSVVMRARAWLGVEQVQGVLTVPGHPLHWAGTERESATALETRALMVRVLQSNEAMPDQIPLTLHRATLLRLSDRGQSFGLLVLTDVQPHMAYLMGVFAPEFSRVLEDMTNRDAVAHTNQIELRNRSVGSMAFSLAHEMNNLLQVISVSAGMQIRTQALQDASAQARVILEATRQGRTLLEPLLVYGGNSDEQDGWGDVHNAVRTALTIIRAATPSRVQVHLQLDATRCVVECEESLLKTVAINLALNAIQAMSRNGGMLRITSREVDAPLGLGDLRGVTFQGPCLELIFADNGPGIAPNILPAIFEGRQTTRLGGHGLGLPTVYSIIRQVGGHIEVKSDPQLGAEFRLIFRLRGRNQLARWARRRDLAGTRVLVCEDNDLLREVITRWLEDAHCQVTACADGAACVRTLSSQPDAWDVMLLDYRMPVITGRDVFEVARERAPHLPVIMLSGHRTEIDLTLLRSRGLAAFLQKPVDNDVIHATILAVLDRSTRYAHGPPGPISES